MKHYVCVGECAGEAERPGVCQSEGCDNEGQPLTECNCEDGSHDEAIMGGIDDESGEEEY